MNHSAPSADAYANEPVRFAPLTVVDIGGESAAVKTVYHNQVLCRISTSCLRLAVIEGQYPWHQHPRSDELFLVVEGTLEIELADGHGSVPHLFRDHYYWRPSQPRNRRRSGRRSRYRSRSECVTSRSHSLPATMRQIA